jgi:hypothetical protein
MSARLRRAWSAVASQASGTAMWIALFSLLAGVALMSAVLIYAYLQGDRALSTGASGHFTMARGDTPSASSRTRRGNG